MTVLNFNNAFPSPFVSGAKAMRDAEKRIEEAKPGPISSSRMVHLIENERMFEMGAQVIRAQQGVVGMALNVKR